MILNDLGTITVRMKRSCQTLLLAIGRDRGQTEIGRRQTEESHQSQGYLVVPQQGVVVGVGVNIIVIIYQF
jgi:hypothetical protein